MHRKLRQQANNGRNTSINPLRRLHKHHLSRQHKIQRQRSSQSININNRITSRNLHRQTELYQHPSRRHKVRITRRINRTSTNKIISLPINRLTRQPNMKPLRQAQTHNQIINRRPTTNHTPRLHPHLVTTRPLKHRRIRRRIHRTSPNNPNPISRRTLITRPTSLNPRYNRNHHTRRNHNTLRIIIRHASTITMNLRSTVNIINTRVLPIRRHIQRHHNTHLRRHLSRHIMTLTTRPNILRTRMRIIIRRHRIIHPRIRRRKRRPIQISTNHHNMRTLLTRTSLSTTRTLITSTRSPLQINSSRRIRIVKTPPKHPRQPLSTLKNISKRRRPISTLMPRTRLLSHLPSHQHMSSQRRLIRILTRRPMRRRNIAITRPLGMQRLNRQHPHTRRPRMHPIRLPLRQHSPLKRRPSRTRLLTLLLNRHHPPIRPQSTRRLITPSIRLSTNTIVSQRRLMAARSRTPRAAHLSTTPRTPQRQQLRPKTRPHPDPSTRPLEPNQHTPTEPTRQPKAN